ncbi:MAG TPA: hypothetical protein VMJ10_07545 [Kofleriaceae bacterium]|nr:hypothetical protein [Kofleriaceae bacterium]
MLVETVFRYRTLVGKCDLGVGLDWDEIEQLTQIAHEFAPRDTRTGRKFRREVVELDGVVRGDRINDRVQIVELGPGGLVCRRSPFIARGERVEINVEVFDDIYRFSAQGIWLKDDGEDYRVGLALVGMPVKLHKVALSRHERDVIDRIADAA